MTTAIPPLRPRAVPPPRTATSPTGTAGCPLNMQISANIALMLAEQGIGPTELARRAGIPLAAVSAAMHGNRGWSVRTLWAISTSGFGVRVGLLTDPRTPCPRCDGQPEPGFACLMCGAGRPVILAGG
jgi:hypothetical protein